MYHVFWRAMGLIETSDVTHVVGKPVPLLIETWWYVFL